MLKSQTYIMGNHPQFLFFKLFYLFVNCRYLSSQLLLPHPLITSLCYMFVQSFVVVVYIVSVSFLLFRINCSFLSSLLSCLLLVIITLLSFLIVMYYIPNLFHSVSLSYNDFGSFLSAHTQAGESHCWHHLHIWKKLDWT